MYKATLSFTATNYDIRKNQIIDENFIEEAGITEAEIAEYLSIGYLVEYDGTLEITENGVYDVEDYQQADVDVPSGEPTLQNKSETITENTTTTIQADEGYDGLGTVTVTTNVPQLDTSDANALARYIREGNTAYVNGVKITGTAGIVNTVRSADITTFVRSDKYKNGTDISHSDALFNIKLGNGLIGFITPAQSSVEGTHFDGSKVGTATKEEYVAEKIGLTADVLKSGVTILGITGTYTG